MPNSKMSLPHTLPQEEALKRIKSLLNDARNQYADKISDLKESWNGNVGTFSFSAMGFPVSGTLTVAPRTIDFDGTLPWAAMIFKGKIETIIREQCAKLLAP